jgi:hypothetical protein
MSFGTIQAEKMTTESGYSLGAGNSTSFKNRLMNGAMEVNQYGTSAVSLASSDRNFAFDRFLVEQGGYTTNNGTVQQISISNTFGFANAGRVTAPTSSSGTTSAFIAFNQRIEGFNLQDLAYGSSAAKPLTLSFWVYSSLVGQYTLNLTHYDGTTERWSQNTYTITTANTWQFVSVTFSGDTTTTIANDNGANGWLRVYWNLGGGSAITGGSNPTNTWANASSYGGFRQQAGSVNFNNTSGAIWQVTGCQLEVGTVATSFDWRPYGTELNLCQRYCEVLSFDNDQYTGASGFALTSGTCYFSQAWTQVKRASPTVTFTGTNWNGQGLADTASPTAISATRISLTGANILLTASFGGTNGQAVNFRSLANSQKITISAEL